MVREWLIPAISFGWLVLLVWTNRVSYRHGIWDGAFNQFLPVVRREMLFYDERRAREIFETETKGGNDA